MITCLLEGMKIGKISENILKRSVLKLIKTENKKETSAAASLFLEGELKTL